MLPSRKSQRRQNSDTPKQNKKGEEWILKGTGLTSKKRTDAMPN
jgi:hypothetical protein